MPYQWDLLPRLASAIEHAQAPQALAELDQLLAEISDGIGGDVAMLRLRCAQCMSACMRGARRGGAPSQILYDEHLAALRTLSVLPTPARVRTLMRRYVKRLAEQVQPSRRTRMERIVHGMLGDMAATLDRPRTLEQYAHDSEVSVGHLSRSFTQIAGRPFREEALRLRDEAACALLTGTRLPMTEIARRVGLRSTSQFIADFKVAHGVTPSYYRRRGAGG